MNRNDQYLSHAADCHLMACMTRDEHERQTWLDMAQTWLQLVELPKGTSLSPFDKNTLIIAGRRGIISITPHSGGTSLETPFLPKCLTTFGNAFNRGL